MSDDQAIQSVAGPQASGEGIAEAFARAGSIIHRVRYREELVLVEKHVHVEALTVRDPALEQTVARGVRILMRSQPVEEPPRERSFEFAAWTPEPMTPAWLDPVPEGRPYQQSQNVFVDDSEIPTLLEGLDGLAQTADRWRRNEIYSTAEWFEAVFAWSDAFIVGLLRREVRQECYLASRVPLQLHFPIPEGKLARLRAWLKKAKTALDEAP